MLDPLETPDLQTLLCFNVYATGHSFNRFYQPILEPLGITYPQFLVLLTLLREDGRGVGEIGETLMLDTNTLSPLLKRMEVRGLLSRRRLAHDERRVVADLTEAGRAVAERAAAIPDCIAECLNLPPEDLRRTTAVLTRLRRLMAELTPPATPLAASG